MGYRSDIAAVVHGDSLVLNVVWAQFKDRQIAWGKDYADPDTTFAEYFGPYLSKAVNGNREVLRFAADDWKWYDSYPCVILWDEFMDACRDAGLTVEFVRVGEEGGDVEVRHDCPDGNDYYLSVVTSIDHRDNDMKFERLFPWE